MSTQFNFDHRQAEIHASQNKVKVTDLLSRLNEEKKIGSEYETNIEISFLCDFEKLKDNLENTVDYVTVSKVVDDEMKNTCNLLETVINRIGNKLLRIDNKINSVAVEIKKINPPIVGVAQFVSVKDEFKR